MIVEVGDVRLDLTPDQVEDLRRQLGIERSMGDGLIDAAEVARRCGLSRDAVYAHAAELGAVRVGSGSRPRLRFDPAVVTERMAAKSAPVDVDRGAPKPPRRRSERPRRDLLPIRGARP